MALLNGTAGKQPAPTANDDLVGADTGNETMNGEESPDDGADDRDDGQRVLFTVMVDEEGKYTLVTGDEEDEEDGLAAPEGAGPAEGGTPAMPEGQQFDEIGPLLKACLDLLRGSGGGEADSGQADFEAGFGGGNKAEA
jgi:hypothetical protein